MESFLVIVAIVAGVWILKAIFGKNDKEEPAAVELLTARIIERRLDEKDDASPMIKVVEGKGLLPHTQRTNIDFVVSLLDGNKKPVICPIEKFQESGTIAYQDTTHAGNLEPCGIRDWARLGIIIPVLIPPRGGKQQLIAVLRVIDAGNPPKIISGKSVSNTGILWEQRIQFQYNYDGKGYEEQAEHRDESRVLSVKIAMAVAMADGSLDNAEGNVIKNWIKREISPYEEEKRERMRDLYNNALREADADAKHGALNINRLARRLDEIGEKPVKYETMELCYDIMSADGIAHKAEMEMLNQIGEMLKLDMREIGKMRDNAIMGLDANFAEDDAQNMLGINPGWDREKIKKHLRGEFKKWIARSASLSVEKERDHARRMLDLIAQEQRKINREEKGDGQ